MSYRHTDEVKPTQSGFQITAENLIETMSLLCEQSGASVYALAGRQGINEDTLYSLLRNIHGTLPSSRTLDGFLAAIGWELVAEFWEGGKKRGWSTASAKGFTSADALDLIDANGKETPVPKRTRTELHKAGIIDYGTHWRVRNGQGQLSPRVWLRAFHEMRLAVFVIPIAKPIE